MGEIFQVETRAPQEAIDITARVQEAFFSIVEGKVPDRHGWLTHVDPS